MKTSGEHLKATGDQVALGMSDNELPKLEVPSTLIIHHGSYIDYLHPITNTRAATTLIPNSSFAFAPYLPEILDGFHLSEENILLNRTNFFIYKWKILLVLMLEEVFSMTIRWNNYHSNHSILSTSRRRSILSNLNWSKCIINPFDYHALKNATR